MFILLAVLLSAAAFFIVAYPILSTARAAATTVSSAQETLDEFMAQRDAAFQALRDLSFDHQVGKITDEDFVAFEAHLKGVAADALQALDEWEAATDRSTDAALEGEIAARVKTFSSGGRGSGRRCLSCGRTAAAEEKFCPSCGSSLTITAAAVTPAALACPNCGRPSEDGDRFCAGCGQPLAQAGGVRAG